ncbi:MAG: 3'-5' exoribonuclease [Desulfovibrionaceae bacterium]|nr:3'-5' exoribonuclease [Desulfovibrionaceae bacterium]
MPPNKSLAFQVGCAIDFETSSTDPSCACSLGLTRIEGEKIGDSYYTLLRPPSSVVHFFHIHHLSWNDLKTAPLFAEVWPQISDYLQDVQFFIAHNASFDRRVLNACLDYAHLDASKLPFLCTLKGARKVLSMRSHSLDKVCEYFHISLNHHNAASDAQACAQIYLHLLSLGASAQSMLLKEKTPSIK